MAAQGISKLTVKLTETSTNYHDTLLRQPAQVRPLNTPCTVHFAPRLKAREGVRSRQILIDFESDQGLILFADDPITVLKGRFNKALQDIEDANGHKTRAISHLRNGGVLMELGSEEAVTWFAGAVIRKQFLEKLHLVATITKPRLYQVMVQFVPLTFQPDREADLREVEEVNSINVGGIVRARWIKPVARCKPSQTCGHLILSFQFPQPANDTLAYGLYIGQKKVFAEKCKWELLWCLKCHGWGHCYALNPRTGPDVRSTARR